jgi:excisionase family DNA binding protein
MDPLAYSIADACKLLGVGRTTLYAAIKRGELKCRKVGRRTVITGDAMKSWLSGLPTKSGRAILPSTEPGKDTNDAA